MNTVAEACLRCWFWPKNHEKATTCELAHYRGAIPMTGCSTIPGVLSVLLHVNGV